MKSTLTTPSAIFLAAFLLFSGNSINLRAQSSSGEGCFEVAENGTSVPLFADQNDDPGILRAFSDLQKDIERVTGFLPELSTTGNPTGSSFILAGSIGNNTHIDALIASGKLDVSDVEDKWEAYTLQVVEKPFPGVGQALVIAGSDKRGTIYGIYEISKQMGVSPWYYWADVPVPHKENISVVPGCTAVDSPHLEYKMYLQRKGEITVHVYMSPTLDIHGSGGLRFAVSVDDQTPEIVTMDINKDYGMWAKAVSSNTYLAKTKLHIEKPGEHTLKFWMVDPGVVLQKLVVDTGGLKSSYLGPPESFHGEYATRES